ncbi:MAG: pyruvate dehydrogenase complex dihydrolipoamide acetyltransferase [Rhodobacteraceae bacterium]|jgi:pyruvate dehydrogenase E2 component (dihydrolipoamide acetyltransferase)|nr:pyruvate dehydrogenase complex dihydrolipoamide acetyltransferase [Paracoccaceae bacterium]
MSVNILMPALSPTMEEGTLAKWLVKEGDRIQSGDLIAEIETDKATMEFEAVDEGIIGKLLVTEGSEGVKVNSPIAIILDDGEDLEVQETKDITSQVKPKEQTVISAAPLETKNPLTGVAQTSSLRIFATPLARRLAKENGVDLGSINGSGPHGRIVKNDVLNINAFSPIANQETLADPVLRTNTVQASGSSVENLYADREFKEIPLNSMRKTVATRLTEAKQNIPHFYLRKEIKIDELLQVRSRLNAHLAERNNKLSINDFIIKSCALALQSVPMANAVWAEDKILQLKPSDIAVAVSVEDGLFTPIIRDADEKSLSNLSKEMKELAEKARSKKLMPSEYQGGSFSISNLGMFGVDDFDAVINPPHGAILAVGRGLKKPIVNDDDTISVANVMSLTLSVDHRVIDGALGADLLQNIAKYLEDPVLMLT